MGDLPQTGSIGLPINKAREKITGFDAFYRLIEDGLATSPSLRLYARDPVMLPRLAEQHTVYQRTEKTAERNPENDREYPLEKTRLESFNAKHDADIDNATVHIGPHADEFARSHNAEAVTTGTDIFFRHGAYKPETEEGRKTIAHELTHVAQYLEKRVTENADKDELEKEAQRAESKETETGKTIYTMLVGGKLRFLDESQMEAAAEMLKEIMLDKLEEYSILLDEKEYIRLLAKLQKIMKDGTWFDLFGNL